MKRCPVCDTKFHKNRLATPDEALQIIGPDLNELELDELIKAREINNNGSATSSV